MHEFQKNNTTGETRKLQSWRFETLSRSSAHHEYSPVAVSVDAPQLHVGLSSDCGCSGGTVDESQLTKAASFPNAGHPLVVHIHLAEAHRRHVNTDGQNKHKSGVCVCSKQGSDTDIHLPLVDDIKIVTFVTCVNKPTVLASHGDVL